MPVNAGSGRATASCPSCGHIWTVAAGEDPKKCPECGWIGSITVSAVKTQRQKRRNF